ncbi:MAG: glycogen/starch/alpha-glucan family phosphorylase [Burkholderiales bacterium]|nr:glycogen/starch/alpha-glucan family phosphorylase [Burkholderiales bacterium]
MEKEIIQQALETKLNCILSDASDRDLYYALLEYLKQQTSTRPQLDGSRKIYYISSEFLIGKMLSNNLINLGLYHHVNNLLKEHGKHLSTIEEIEPEPSLGNGGLGRLAACFLDSIATLGIPGRGIGLNYHYGLFKQKFSNNLQSEQPNPWIEDAGWLNKTDISYDIQFTNFTVKSCLYEFDVVGYRGSVNKLSLFDIEGIDTSIVHDGIAFDKNDIAKNLTLFLYPDDSDQAGHLLRIFQQYFMVSNAVHLIFAEMDAKGYDYAELDKHVVIQINDTHPTLVIPELIRQLLVKGLPLEQATAIVKRSVAYTNHTILAEALEKWPLSYLEKVVPTAIINIIKYLDTAIKAQYTDPSVDIIDQDGRVHMARIDIHYCFSVNGVAALHTKILKNSELKQFNDIYPNKFNNKTNGITFRRWIMQSNSELTDFLAKTIGNDFKFNSLELDKLMSYTNDSNVLSQIDLIKQTKKQQFTEYIKVTAGIKLNPQSIFDVQVKRIHEYKRQQMNALYVIHKYLEIKEGKLPSRPLTVIFGGKAAPAYTIAKHVIHLILCLQQLINSDPEVSPHLQVVFVENYNVTVAEKLIPAADISEQISLASKEASGTGNMKFMLNGAVTIGTMDGANVEIAELVGPDNIYTFGKDSNTIIELYRTNGYHSWDYYFYDLLIKRAVDFINSPGMLAIGTKERLDQLHHELITKDWYMTLIDFVDYIKTKDQMLSDYENREQWNRMSLVNIAKAGYFSSDRTIRDYNQDIWKIDLN